ncbi:endonuclease/exonuclease/phosphatase family protein [uncultured Lutibacter sp.]|uniref:endonuclease/exonuclease/phosphatase family protein n=1 Tax=uncultured Lutibacter sp. TaxID=437739 RepID=UPI00261A7EAD|nr:endonuclease/exonuclease/phosphatase family protein [uncultured Lutibacter sp.]
MKKLSWFDKLIVVVNSLFAMVLLFSFLSYYISPNTFSFISFLSLSLPILILINLLFVIYWFFKLKRQFLISSIILLIGFQYVTKLYSFKEKKILLSTDLKIMSYNVRMFNIYNWIDEENIDQKIYEFINEKEPDILCLQEFNPTIKIGFKFPYQYIKASKKSKLFGHAIFSKYKIINSGSLDFLNSSNNAIFVDIIKNKDTMRVYNVHLESLSINPKEDYFNQENSEKLRIRVDKAFKKQADQAELIIQHQEKITHKSIICGDFNNNAFSWVYHTLKNGKNDAFEVAGEGFGKSYNHKFPLRIDFILADDKFEINNFKTFEVNYSDHYPIMARLNF